MCYGDLWVFCAVLGCVGRFSVDLFGGEMVSVLCVCPLNCV